jgi:hypothetical protein
MSQLNTILNEEDEESPLPKNVSPYKIELHALISNNDVKEVKNRLKNMNPNFLLTKDRMGLNTIEFSKRFGSREVYHIVQEKIIKDKQGIISCFKNLKHNVY